MNTRVKHIRVQNQDKVSHPYEQGHMSHSNFQYAMHEHNASTA